MRTFIRQHRRDIDDRAKAIGYSGRLSDTDREDLVMNDEGLYNLAKSKGVSI